MIKFGDLINIEKPVLINFFSGCNKVAANLEVLRHVSATTGTTASIIKIDIEKNQVLADALRVKGNPTFMIYKNGKMKWRQTGPQDAQTLIGLVQQYL